jgi:glycerol-3-phosphate O-acyltransferase
MDGAGRAPMAKIFHFMHEREDILREVVDRVVREKLADAQRHKSRSLEYILNEAAYYEMQRLEKGSSKLDLRPYSFWQDLARSVGRASEPEKSRLLRELTAAYAEDVGGKFTPAVYRFASRVLPLGLSVLFNAQTPEKLLRRLPRLSEQIHIQGEVETLRRLCELGTLIVVPTHSSNLDSIVVGWGLEASGLPPMTYGAGKNLFTNPLTSFFMQHLGAYKVDRRIKHSLYKDVLKTYSEVLLERGYHSLFFPGGTRSRSNQLESHLKLGLLGSALTAYTHNLMAHRERPKIFICPLTINFHLVLEAETLIGEHLRQDGGARYIIEDDEFADFGKVLRYAMRTMSMERSIYLHFAPPLDVFGNAVDMSGTSLDPRGRPIDAERYLWKEGRVALDRERDAEYTRECGSAVAEAFRRNTVVLSTSLLSHALFQLLEETYPGVDLYRLLRVAKGERIPLSAVQRRTAALREALRRLADRSRVHLADDVAELPIADLVSRAAAVLGMYHPLPVVTARAEEIEVGQPNLLHFYANRLTGYGLESAAEKPQPRAAAEAAQ